MAGVELASDTEFTCDVTTGAVTFLPGHVPASGAPITAGFLFDVPVRFDTDYLDVDNSAFAAGAIPRIPLVEIRGVTAGAPPWHGCAASRWRRPAVPCRDGG